MSDARIDSAILYDLPPFARQLVEFPIMERDAKLGEVHLFVGENGTGKTRLLSLLASACGNETELKARLQRTATNFVASTDNGKLFAWGISGNRARELRNPRQDLKLLLECGSVVVDYDDVNFERHWLLGPDGDNTLALAFRGSARMTDTDIKPLGEVAFGGPQENLLFDRQPNEDALFGQAMANLKIRAGMYVASLPGESSNRNVRIADRLEKSVTHVTGRDFYFVVEESPKLQLRVTWGEKRMHLQQLPDGLCAIIGWLAACVAKIESIHYEHENPLDLPVVLLIDEPESHLHPAWQRKDLPALQHLLPNAQIFVATHSPFVISSVNHGFYYVLRADDDGVVTVDPAKPCSKGDTYMDVVQDILGVQEWYDIETEEELKKFRTIRDNAERHPIELNIDAMRSSAFEIAKRSESLKDMMARELAQFDRQFAAASGNANK